MTESVVKYETKENNVVSLNNQSPMDAMALALSKGADLEQLEKMLALQEKWEQMEAKKAYTQAMADFKLNPPIITKDKVNGQYKSNYTSLGNLVNSSLPQMSKCGLSHKWEIDQAQNNIKVTCIVTHQNGHSESTSMSAPPDGSGSKNPIQQIKSTITYLKAATFESIMGLASSDANFDDDGNSAAITYINDKQVSQITDMINATNTDEPKFLKWMGADSVELIPENLFNKAMAALKAKAA